MSSSIALLDSNILVFAHSPTQANHKTALSLVKAGMTGASQYAIAHQNLLEWLSVMSSPRVTRKPVPTLKLLKDIQRYERSALIVIRPMTDTLQCFQEIVVQLPAQGKDIYDRYLAATALSNGITTILTENVKNFAGIRGLTAVNPFA